MEPTSPLPNLSGRALLVDFGGVLTVSVLESFAAACAALGVDGPGFLRDCFSGTQSEDSPFVALELGKISTEEFGALVTPVLQRHSARPVDGRDWYAAVEAATWNLDDAMVEAIGGLVDEGIPTALVSNSWGATYSYPWESLPRFTEVLVSRDVGMRKPDPAIYQLAADRLGVSPSACVFVDDLEVNLAPAREMGMTTILHENSGHTIIELRKFFDGVTGDR
jgi:putative hydrolase of the HAD superfamily